jgi:hypothetical protein
MVVVAFLDIVVLNSFEAEEAKATNATKYYNACTIGSSTSSPKQHRHLEKSKEIDSVQSPDTAATFDTRGSDSEYDSMVTNPAGYLRLEAEGDSAVPVAKGGKAQDRRKSTEQCPTGIDQSSTGKCHRKNIFACLSADEEEAASENPAMPSGDTREQTPSVRQQDSLKFARKEARVTFSDKLEAREANSGTHSRSISNREQTAEYALALDRFHDLLRIEDSIKNLAGDYRDIQEKTNEKIQRLRQGEEQEEKAVVLIQRAYRRRISEIRVVARTKTQSQYRQAGAAAIQKSYRGHLARVHKGMRKRASSKSQVQYRTRSSVLRYRVFQFACRVLQRNNHTQKTKRHAAASTIQRRFRDYISRLQIVHQDLAATKVQAQYRMQSVARRYRALQNAARLLQRSCRTHSQGAKRHTAAIVIQSCYRGHLTRVDTAADSQERRRKGRKSRTQKKAAEQATSVKKNSSRGHSSIRYTEETTQSQWLHRSESLTGTILGLQYVYRTLKGAYQGHRNETEDHVAAVTIQRFYRGHAAGMSKKRRDTAVIVIQAYCRMQGIARVYHRFREAHRRHHNAASAIQRDFRRHRERTKRHAAAVSIQGTCRGHNARRKIDIFQHDDMLVRRANHKKSIRERHAATVIQRSRISDRTRVLKKRPTRHHATANTSLET